jgi:hypothetical protein
MSHNIILQAMDDDYIDLCDISRLHEALSTASSAGEDTYHFNIYLGRVSSAAPYAFVAYHHSHGFFLSLRVPTGDGLVSFVARGRNSSSEKVDVVAGQHHLQIPQSLFLCSEEARRCLDYFCETATLHPQTRWIQYDRLGFELYA